MVLILVLFLAEWPLFSAWLDHKLGPEDGVAWPDEEPVDQVFSLGNALPIPGQMVLRISLFRDGFGHRGGKLRRAYVPFSHIVAFKRAPTFQISLFTSTKWSTIAYERNGRRRRLGVMNPTFDKLQEAYDERMKRNRGAKRR